MLRFILPATVKSLPYIGNGAIVGLVRQGELRLRHLIRQDQEGVQLQHDQDQHYFPRSTDPAARAMCVLPPPGCMAWWREGEAALSD